MRIQDRTSAKAKAMGSTLRRAIPILVAAQQLTKTGNNPADASIEVQVLTLAEKFESLVSDTRGGKMSPAQAVESIAKGFGSKYDSMIVDAFVKAFSQQAAGAGALSHWKPPLNRNQSSAVAIALASAVPFRNSSLLP